MGLVQAAVASPWTPASYQWPSDCKDPNGGCSYVRDIQIGGGCVIAGNYSVFCAATFLVIERRTWLVENIISISSTIQASRW